MGKKETPGIDSIQERRQVPEYEQEKLALIKDSYAILTTLRALGIALIISFVVTGVVLGFTLSEVRRGIQVSRESEAIICKIINNTRIELPTECNLFVEP